MVLCKKVVIFSVSKPRQIHITIDLQYPYPHITEMMCYIHEQYNRLLPKSGWVPRAIIRRFDSELHLELVDRVWLLL